MGWIKENFLFLFFFIRLNRMLVFFLFMFYWYLLYIDRFYLRDYKFSNRRYVVILVDK